MIERLSIIILLINDPKSIFQKRVCHNKFNDILSTEKKYIKISKPKTYRVSLYSHSDNTVNKRQKLVFMLIVIWFVTYLNR
jgi:hypothetical protein